MIDVFLSASIPLPNRDRAFFDSSDVIAIREAIKALVEVVLPIGRITCGGHPAITPLLLLFSRQGGYDRERVTIFQSELFQHLMPDETRQFSDVRIVPQVEGDRAASLTAMRSRMVQSRAFRAGVFIGGMEGLFEELDLFRQSQPNALIMPLASTGAAAGMIFAQGDYPSRYFHDMTYSSLFRRDLAKLDKRD